MKILNEKWIRIFFPLLFGSFIYLTIILTTFEPNLLRGYIHNVLQMYLIFEMVRLAGKFTYKKSSFNNLITKNIIKHLIISIIITIPLALIFYSIWKYTFTIVRPRFSDVTINNYIYYTLWCTIEIMISLFLQLAVKFVNNWQVAVFQKEKLEKDNITAKFNALKNEINPHFLFNNLNTLYGLIHEDKKTAAEYLLNLSDIYRYILQSNSKEIVTLKEELNIIKSYTMLLKNRYGNNITFEIDKSIKDDLYIPTLCLQMLIENCIKHNVIDENNKLTIKIYYNNEMIIVENNINPIKTNDASGFGLINIKNRYSFLTDKEVIIEDDKTTFIVKLPLLKTTNYENINY